MILPIVAKEKINQLSDDSSFNFVHDIITRTNLLQFVDFKGFEKLITYCNKHKLFSEREAILNNPYYARAVSLSLAMKNAELEKPFNFNVLVDGYNRFLLPASHFCKLSKSTLSSKSDFLSFVINNQSSGIFLPRFVLHEAFLISQNELPHLASSFIESKNLYYEKRPLVIHEEEQKRLFIDDSSLDSSFIQTNRHLFQKLDENRYSSQKIKGWIDLYDKIQENIDIGKRFHTSNIPKERYKDAIKFSLALRKNDLAFSLANDLYETYSSSTSVCHYGYLVIIDYLKRWAGEVKKDPFAKILPFCYNDIIKSYSIMNERDPNVIVDLGLFYLNTSYMPGSLQKGIACFRKAQNLPLKNVKALEDRIQSIFSDNL